MELVRTFDADSVWLYKIGDNISIFKDSKDGDDIVVANKVLNTVYVNRKGESATLISAMLKFLSRTARVDYSVRHNLTTDDVSIITRCGSVRIVPQYKGTIKL